MNNAGIQNQNSNRKKSKLQNNIEKPINENKKKIENRFTKSKLKPLFYENQYFISKLESKKIKNQCSKSYKKTYTIDIIFDLKLFHSN